MHLTNLYDVPSFSNLRSITQAFNIEITAIGGLVRRIATKLRDSNDLPSDLLTLVPFSSDIDLIHTGSTEQTDKIASAIIDSVPFGESLRWQIRSRRDYQPFAEALSFSDIVPANLLTLSTDVHTGISDPHQGVEDIRRRAYRFIRNRRYGRSPLYRAGRDLEMLAALLYFKILLDDTGDIEAIKIQPGLGAARSVIYETCATSNALEAFQELDQWGPYLRARCLYLLKDIRGLVFDPNIWPVLRSISGLDALERYLLKETVLGFGAAVSEILNTTRPLMISAHLHEEYRYRAPNSTSDWYRGETCKDIFRQTLNRHNVELAPGQEVICASPPIPIAFGISESEHENEFIHAAVPLDPETIRQLEKAGSEDLSIVMELSGDNTDGRSVRPILFSPPAVCSVAWTTDAAEGMLWIRINAFGLFETARKLTGSSDCSVRLYLIKKIPETGETFAVDEHDVSTLVIFVHGIFSDSRNCFAEVMREIAADERSCRYALYPFDYDFHNDIRTSGCRLVEFIKRFPSSTPIILVAHSMGGLVGRTAVLTGEVPNVKRLIMLGTPNFGVLRTAQTGLLSQLSLRIAGKLYAIFRKPGLQQLTQISKVLEKQIEEGQAHARNVEYVTIPGEYFHASRGFFDITGKEDAKIWSVAFGAIGLTSEMLNAVPLWRMGLERPHDGIVERQSNSLIPSDAGRWSEKSAELNNPDRFGRTYFHIEHKACADLTHVSLQHHPAIVSLVKDLVFADTLEAWHQRLSDDQIGLLKVRAAGQGS